MPPLSRGCTVGDRYKIDSDGPIAEGTYAHVYRAKDKKNNGRFVAVKVEAPLYSGSRSVLKAEANVLRFLQRQPGVPCYVDFKENDEVARGSLVVMELLGEDLGIALHRVRRLSSHTVAFVGLQMLRSIQAVHEKGLVHRDIKPNNFLFGRGGECLKVYTIDFGLGRRHLNKDGVPRVPRKRCEFRGTTRYASVSAHQNKDQGRVDDLWSLIFALLELCAGQLPWNFYKSQAALGPEAKVQAKQRVLAEKIKLIEAARNHDNKPFGFLRQVPPQFADIMRALDGLGYADVPDYDGLAAMLRSVGTEEVRAQAAKRELLTSDAMRGVGLRHSLKLPSRLPVAPAAEKVSVRKRRLPTEEASTADTQDSKKARNEPSIATPSWAVASNDRWWKLQVDRTISAEPLVRRAEDLAAAFREHLGEA
mmetsp:Transcript_23029/g.46668  ORF Transcript_23029/g.46668 Transcript_23029/m.46668 type:complete len:421 (-) Transcript_23029:143-1405(-)|eukprot:CAMPEP_0113818470 /NCGR_PEP_ID=MMETSP0328-20130328/256_1 /TAXON_ID=39455 /ORGANISM="Alexandrium minutum" /LENGTH=420 /DNA_ID=CAMNT_0000786405 /DNA_START=63 /DNA_END=1325 /DNA_ORIENTATION=- /assembly_acc=CAM_ASM_000350